MARSSRWGMDAEQADLACLLVSEVVTNVVLHAAISPSPRHEFALEPAHAAGCPGSLDGLAELAGTGRRLAEALSAACQRHRSSRSGCAAGSSAVWVEVFDTDLRLPRIRSAEETDEGGRGLYLVDQLASRWGSRPTKDGKAVWFEMPDHAAARAGRR